MTPQFICFTCNSYFSSLNELNAHEQGGHTPQGISLAPAPPINAEFDQTMAAIEADKKIKMREEIEKLKAESKANHQLPEAKPVEKKPLQLEYKFTGTDSEGHEVTTIVLETPAGIYASAFCVSENRQILTIKVEPIPKHTPEVTIGDTMIEKKGRK